MNKLLVKDQTIGGKIIKEIELVFDSNQITLRELITNRVSSEVKYYNVKEELPFYGLVTPVEKEATLNKNHEPKRVIDIEKQTYIALDGFLKNQFFVLVDDIQIDALDHQIKVNSINSVQFIKLTPLVGG